MERAEVVTWFTCPEITPLYTVNNCFPLIEREYLHSHFQSFMGFECIQFSARNRGHQFVEHDILSNTTAIIRECTRL